MSSPQIIHTVQPMQPTGAVSGVWSTSTFECLKDEESCWWSTWCCCLVSGRTAESLQLESAKVQSVGFVILILVSVVTLLVFPLLGFFILLGGLAYYAYHKAKLRTTIREQLNIPGTLMSDYTVHFWCPCCAVAQEAREAKIKNVKELDFVYGEELSTIAFPQVERGGYMTSRGSSTDVAASQEGAEVNLLDRLKHVSKLSHTILRMWLAVVVATFIALLITGRGLSILVLILVFVQPFLILYFVYWRDPEKNKHVSLDYVIKLFAVGFFMSTSQSIVFESILEGILQMVVGIVLIILNPSMNDSDDGDSPDQAQQIVNALRPHFTKSGSWSTLLNAAFHNSYEFLTSAGSVSYESGAHWEHRYHAGEVAPDGHAYLPFAATSVSVLSASNGTDSDSGFTPELMRKNFFIVILALFVMAFVIAAGVEETMKHFAVRCCRFPAPLKDPKSALIYLMTAALGFATSENIEYVFGANKSPIPGTSLLVGELFVLLIRICMPVHVICSVMQATSLSKVMMGLSSMGVIEIMLPAILLHGTFDFVLFLMGAIEAAEFEVNLAALEAMSYIVPLGITAFGVYIAYTGFKSVLATFDSEWQTLSGDSAHNPVAREEFV